MEVGSSAPFGWLGAGIDALERRAFQALNAVALPSIRHGFGAPCLTPWGLVVLEHTGRHSGRDYASPLLALRLGSRVVVTTFRAERSQWIRNLEEQPRTHLWMNGRRSAYRAHVLRDDVGTRAAREQREQVGAHGWRLAQALMASGFAVSVLEPA